MTRTEDWADYLDPSEPGPDLPPEQSQALDRVTAALATAELWDTPPPGLRAGLLDAARAEQAARPATAPSPSTSPAPSATPAPVVPLRRHRRVWYAAVGLAAAAALAVVVVWPQQEQTSFALAGTALAPRAKAEAVLEPKAAGLAIHLHISGLAPAPEGGYYAAWLKGSVGIVPVGTFHWRKGGIPIELWSGVDSAQYPTLFVTVQREGQPPSPTALIVLSGSTNG